MEGPIKSHVRLLGVDDGPFEKGQGRAAVVAVLLRLPQTVESVRVASVEVDGRDATQVVSALASAHPVPDQAEAVLVDGAALGGFNVVDLGAVHRATGVPAISVAADPPDLEAVERALRAHFTDWESRLATISAGEVYRTGEGGVWFRCAGVEPDRARALLRLSTVIGRYPEPLRIAHLVARGIGPLAERRSKGTAMEH